MRLVWFLPLALLLPSHAFAFDPPTARREAVGVQPYFDCRLSVAVNGTCGNYKWYNLCAGYIWVYSGWQPGESVGIRFGGAQQPCIRGAACDGFATPKRAITYFRDTTPGYGQLVDIYLDVDANGDGCADLIRPLELNFDPWERWNCWNFPHPTCGIGEYVDLRIVHHGGEHPSLVTDGPYSDTCDPVGRPGSFYYGINRSVCMPWAGPTSRKDNFLAWIIMDLLPGHTATESMSWGRIKGLYK